MSYRDISNHIKVWLDAMHYKVKVDGKITHKALYNILGITKEEKKEILGMYISESEGANFWLQVLTNLHNRGLQDPDCLYR
ncbi:transposase [Autumnicola edwardsiae]|uniref:transposase n=1 Tax=Autumnicola edwardsiae TaxID=3075594 RepID=UPI003D77AB79